MTRLTLPRRSQGALRTFWLLVSAVLGLGSGLLTARTKGDRRWLLAALPVSATIAAPGLRWPRTVVDVPYRAWNRLARLASTALTAYLTRIGFTVVTAEQRRDPSGGVSMAPEPVTGWQPRTSQTAAAYRFQDHDAIDLGTGDAFDRFIAHPRNAWARPLRPVVRLLAAVEADRSLSSRPPSDVYTLY